MTTPKERMSEEQLRWAREGLADPLPYSNESARDEISRLLNHIDALRAELTAARTPPTSDELAETLTRVRFSCGIDTSDRVQRAFVRLSAAKAEAERERDEARAALAQARTDALEEAAKVVDGLREKHGAPCGTQYAQGIWDQGARNAAAIRALKAAMFNAAGGTE